MTTLAELEQRFLAHVRGGDAFPRSWCAQGLVDSDIGLSIYANAYHSRLGEALEADHPILARYLGDELWSKFCTGYVASHPSRVRSLRTFGAHGPDWLATHAPFSGHAEIAELAAFERLLLDVFDAADAERLGWESMASLDPAQWPGVRLRFHPSVRLIATATNAVDIWRAMKDEKDPPEVKIASAPARLLWRDEDRVTRFRPLEAAEKSALEVGHGDRGDFSALCERLARTCLPDDVPGLALGFLRRWFDDGIVVALESSAAS